MSNNTQTIEVDGFTFTVTYEHDNDADPPWKQGDGNGDVQHSLAAHWQGEGVSDKRPGERPLNTASRSQFQYYYDWAGAGKEARKDGWNTPPYDAPNRVHRAVLADFKYMQDWIEGNWEHVCVEVTLANRPEYTSHVCGVETFTDYHLEYAEELAQEVIEMYLDDMEKGELKGMKTTGANALDGDR